MAPAHGEPDEKLEEALHGAQIRPRGKQLPKQAADVAKARAGGRQGRAKRSDVAADKTRLRLRRGRHPTPAKQGAVIQAEDGTVIVERDLPSEERVADPTLGSYKAIAEVLD